MLTEPTVIQSKMGMIWACPEKLNQAINEIVKAPNAAAEPIIPAKFLGIFLKPIPLITKPMSGSKGISIIKDILY